MSGPRIEKEEGEGKGGGGGGGGKKPSFFPTRHREKKENSGSTTSKGRAYSEKKKVREWNLCEKIFSCAGGEGDTDKDLKGQLSSPGRGKKREKREGKRLTAISTSPEREKKLIISLLPFLPGKEGRSCF